MYIRERYERYQRKSAHTPPCGAEKVVSEFLVGVTMNGFRSFLYTLTKLIGDANTTMSKGKVGRRIGRRLAGKAAGKGLGKLFK